MVDLLSHPPMLVMHILEVHCAPYDAWEDKYIIDPCFKELWHALQQPTIINQTPFLDYTIHEGWLYKLSLLCMSHTKDRLILI